MSKSVKVTSNPEYIEPVQPSKHIAFVPEKVLSETIRENKSIVKISNYLAKSDFHSTTIWTGRIFTAICSKIQEAGGKKVEDNYVLQMSDITPKRAGGNDYKNLKDAIRNKVVGEKIIFECGEDPKNPNYGGGGAISIFTHALYDNATTKILISINKDLHPYLINQLSNYTMYKKEEYCSLESIYAQRLFVLLMSEVRLKKNYPVCKIPMDVLMYVIDPPKSARDAPSLFVGTIIKAAADNIIKNTELKFTYEKHKEKNKIDSLYFYFDGIYVIDPLPENQKDIAELSQPD